MYDHNSLNLIDNLKLLYKSNVVNCISPSDVNVKSIVKDLHVMYQKIHQEIKLV